MILRAARGLEHITPEEITLSDWAIDTENTFSKMFRKGDMLFGRRRAYLKKAAQAPFDGICSGDITVIRAKAEILLPDLLPFIIQNDDLFDYAVGKSAGSLSPRVKWESLKNYTFELPDIATQRKLAEILWSINDTLQAYQKLLNETDELVKSQFIKMFGELEAKTEYAPVKALGELISSGPQNGLYKAQSFYRQDGTGIPIVRVDSFYEGKVTSFSSLKRLVCSDAELELYGLHDDDLIFNRVNGSVEHVGKCARILGLQEPTVFESNLMRAQVNSELVDVCYLTTYLCSDIVRKQMNTTHEIGQ